MNDLDVAKKAALGAGKYLSDNFNNHKIVNESSQHDIKLQLDIECQNIIEKIVMEHRPDYSLYGEEGIIGNEVSEYEWIVDPIDGTVNFFYGIPHFCVSIALRKGNQIVLGVIYDPSCNELWEVEEGGLVLLNQNQTKVSERVHLEESIVTVGFSKTAKGGEIGMKRFEKVSQRVRKCRMMGSAALAMSYVASGRLDAYVESEISLWDIAAGKILVESAGGIVELKKIEGTEDKMSIVATNGKIHDEIKSLCGINET